MQFRESIPLAPYTTFGVGGPARWFAEAATEADVLEAVEFARARSLPLFVLGGGSNLLVSDAGFDGLVLRIALRGIEECVSGGEQTFCVAAGEDWDGFVSHAVARNAAGIECLAGIPGTVGGTPVQNVGAYGQEVAETIRRVHALDLTAMRFVELGRDACHFAYRRSLFNSTARGRYIVTRVDYHLAPGGHARIAYADLKRSFEGHTDQPTLAETAAAVRRIRHAKGMLLVEGEPDCRSAGSFFKNPVVPEETLRRLSALVAGEVPHYSAGPGCVKLAAAWLLDQAGFHKGYALGRAGISSRHTLALVNRGDARAEDLIRLRDRIVAAVEESFGIALEPEPVWVGPELA